MSLDRRAAALAASLCLAACLPGTEHARDLADVSDLLHCSGLPKSAAGTWVLTGDGERHGCEESDLDGDIEISSASFEVLQAGLTEGALSLKTPLAGPAGSFDLSGSVKGACVTFSTVESSAGVSLAFSFSGDVEESSITGDFTGTGPGQCQSSGTFEVRVISSPAP